MKKPQTVQALANARARRVVRYLEKQREALQAADANADLVIDIESLVGHLRGLSAADIEAIFSKIPVSREPETGKRLDTSSAELVRNLTLSEVEARIGDVAAPKSDLEVVAAFRFGIPIGSLSRMSRASLVEKIRTLIQNERGHESIRRLLKEEGGSSGR